MMSFTEVIRRLAEKVLGRSPNRSTAARPTKAR
jgi:hypothetical protein